MGYSASFSFSQFAFKPSAIDRLNYIRQCFELYRLVALSVETMPSTGGSAVALGIVPGSTVGSFTGWNFVSVSELQNAKLWYLGETRPIRVNYKCPELGPQLNWLLTTDANGPACNILIGGPATTAVAAKVMIRYTVEFMGPVAQGLMTLSAPVEEKADDLKSTLTVNGASVPTFPSTVPTSQSVRHASDVGVPPLQVRMALPDDFVLLPEPKPKGLGAGVNVD